MEMLKTILNQLNINTSVFTQFVIIFVLYIIAKYLFYGKLQEILEKRQHDTTGLDSQADKTFEKVEALKNEYENKMSGARLKAQATFHQAKEEITKKLDEKFHQRVVLSEKRIQEARIKMNQEISEQKETLMGESKNLAQNLVEKILQ